MCYSATKLHEDDIVGVTEQLRITMAAPYSYDLRQKAIEAVKRGERKSDVCRMLKISRNTRLRRAKNFGGDRQQFSRGSKH